MANNKTGLSYYNVDTDRYMDIRIKRLKKDCGCSGIAVYDYIICEVYRVRGCVLVWDESTAFDVSEYFGLKESHVKEIVKYCGAVGLFDKELLSRGIITSKSIQRRYLDMCNRAKRKDVKIPEEYRIIPEESSKLPEESPEFPEVCRKEKKSKEKESNPPIIPPGGKLDSSDSGTSRQTSGPKKEKVAPKRKNIDLSSVEPSFQPIVADWLAYKSERGQTYRQRGFDAFYSRLLDLSSHSAETARRIIEQSMSNNWAGIFALTTDNYARNSENQSPSRDSLARAVAEGISRAHTRQEWE